MRLIMKKSVLYLVVCLLAQNLFGNVKGEPIKLLMDEFSIERLAGCFCGQREN